METLGIINVAPSPFQAGTRHVRYPGTPSTRSNRDDPALERLLFILCSDRNIINNGVSRLPVDYRRSVLHHIISCTEQLTRVRNHNTLDMDHQTPLISSVGYLLHDLISGVAWDLPNRSTILHIAGHFASMHSRNTHMIAFNILRGLMNSAVDVSFVERAVIGPLFKVLRDINQDIFVHDDCMDEMLTCLQIELEPLKAGKPIPSVAPAVHLG